MLYFVMPYIAGESLRARLDREGKLPVDDAVHIAAQLASALRYAHAAGVVHRDIKPENILLSDGHAWLVDFGVAQAAASTRDARLTATGLIVGSPQYVSPEQARGDGDVDARSDIYSLGCVLYEMLTGRAPFQAKTLEATLLGHMTQQPPSLRDARSDVPARIEQIVKRALAKLPDERFQSAEEFERALTGGALAARPRRLRVSKKLIAGVVVLIAVPVMVMSREGIGDFVSGLGSAAQLDTTRYVVLPFDVPPELKSLHIEQRLSDALAEWQGIDVVDPVEASRALSYSYSDRDAARAARAAGAGRYLLGFVSRTNGALRLVVELHDSKRSGVMAKQRLLSSGADPTSSELDGLVAGILAPAFASECMESPVGTHNLKALGACDRAFSALQDGDISQADSAFQNALSFDRHYARAALWLTQIRTWLAIDPPDLRALASIALADTSSVNRRDRLLARGIAFLSARDYLAAQQTFSTSIARDSTDYAAWLGFADAIRNDEVVLPDPTAKWHWSFRSSYRRALEAYKRAFALKPELIGLYSGRSYMRLRDALLTATSSFRAGHDASGRNAFAAYPELSHDTLAFVPMPQRLFAAGTEGSWPVSLASAVDRERDALRELASNWANMDPNNPAAREALGIAQELSGDRTAIATIGDAARMAHKPDDRVRLLAKQVALRVKFGMPDDLAQVDSARMLAQLLIDEHSRAGTGDPSDLVMPAILLGKATMAASLARDAAVSDARQLNLPTGVVAPAREVLAFAAAGAVSDMPGALEDVVANAVKNAVAPARQGSVLGMLLGRAALVGFPSYQCAMLKRLQRGPAGDAELALREGNAAAAVRIVQRSIMSTRFARPADLTIDVLYAEAAVLKGAGKLADAASRLDATLNAVQWFPPGRLEDFVQMGALIRAAAIRGSAARQAGDSAELKRWSAPLRILWRDADPEVKQQFAPSAN